MAGRKLIDIGANLTDVMFSGIYNGSQKHAPDLQSVLARAYNSGLKKIVITAGCENDIVSAKRLCSTDEHLFYTVGCHPTRGQDFAADPLKYYETLSNFINNDTDRIVAVGECGLDYDREEFCPREVQKVCFQQQLKLASEFGLPLFLHCRNAHSDLLEILRQHIETFGMVTGVVHTFDGTSLQASKIQSLGLFLGFNGCSLRNSDNLEVAASIPSSRLLLESDSPWCDIRPSHAGHKFIKSTFEKKKPKNWNSQCMVAGRNEPSNIIQVLEILAGVRNESESSLEEIIFQNTVSLFPRLLD